MKTIKKRKNHFKLLERQVRNMILVLNKVYAKLKNDLLKTLLKTY